MIKIFRAIRQNLPSEGEIMRLTTLLILTLSQATIIHGQTSLGEIDLSHGKYKVGFRNLQ